jgi:hypothetical protein
MLEGAIAAWDTMLPLVSYYYNITIKSLHKSSPYSLMFTRTYHKPQDGEKQPWLFIDHEKNLDWWMKQQQNVLENVYPAIKESIQSTRDKQYKKFDRSHRIIPELAVGTTVLTKDHRKNLKTDPTYVGPYTIKEVSATGTYVLSDDHDGSTIRRAISDLKPIPTPTLENQTYHAVDSIITHKGSQTRGFVYLVKWKNYDDSANSWVPAHDFQDIKIVAVDWAEKAPTRQTKRPRSKSKPIPASRSKKSKPPRSRFRNHR